MLLLLILILCNGTVLLKEVVLIEGVSLALLESIVSLYLFLTLTTHVGILHEQLLHLLSLVG